MATGGPFPVVSGASSASVSSCGLRSAWADGGTTSLQFLGRHEDPSRTMACYGKNWSRLAELKKRYDPDCFFKNNFWPLDKYGNDVAELYNEPPSPAEDD